MNLEITQFDSIPSTKKIGKNTLNKVDNKSVDIKFNLCNNNFKYCFSKHVYTGKHLIKCLFRLFYCRV